MTAQTTTTEQYKFQVPDQKKLPQHLGQIQSRGSQSSIRSQASTINYQVYDGHGVKPFSKQDLEQRKKQQPDRQQDNDSGEFQSHDILPKLKANLAIMIKKTQKFYKRIDQIEEYIKGIDESFEAIDYNYKTLVDYLQQVIAQNKLAKENK